MTMYRETRIIRRAPEQKIETCAFREAVRRFPLHFHGPDAAGRLRLAPGRCRHISTPEARP